MKDQKESSEAVADEQRSDLFLVVPEGYLMYRNARLVQAQFAAGVGQNHQVVKGRPALRWTLLFSPSFSWSTCSVHLTSENCSTKVDTSWLVRDRSSSRF